MLYHARTNPKLLNINLMNTSLEQRKKEKQVLQQAYQITKKELQQITKKKKLLCEKFLLNISKIIKILLFDKNFHIIILIKSCHIFAETVYHRFHQTVIAMEINLLAFPLHRL